MDPLHGDGVCDALYHWLWCKDELNFGPQVQVPDTVVYKFGQPVHWYFTSVDGKLKRKNKQNLVNARIEEAFAHRVVGCDIVAYYISLSTGEGDDGGEEAGVTSIEYLDRKGLHEFLYTRFKENNGILQRFVEPKGTQNTMVRAIWSPKVCLLERRVNNKHLPDRRYGLYERACTYEGPEFYSNAAPLRGAVLPSRIQNICENVVSHIAEVSFQKNRISRAVLNFKVDARDRVWLLWSSSIRLASEASMLNGTTASQMPLNIDSIVRLPAHVKLDDEPSHGKPRSVSRSSACLSCGCQSPGDQFHSVPYKTIIAHFEQLLAILTVDSTYQNGVLAWPPDPAIIAAAGGVGFGSVNPSSKADAGKAVTKEEVLIPPVLRELHPKLAASVYQRYRRDPLFLYKTATVCEDCFLVYAEIAATSSSLSGAARAGGGPGASARMGSSSGRTTSVTTAAKERTARQAMWQPVGSDASSAGTRRTRRTPAAASTASFKPAATPSFPDAITTASVAHSVSAPSFGRRDDETAGSGGGLGGHSVEDMIQERENEFFAELAASQQLQKGHPLQHMINTFDKMNSIDQLDGGDGDGGPGGGGGNDGGQPSLTAGSMSELGLQGQPSSAGLLAPQPSTQLTRASCGGATTRTLGRGGGGSRSGGHGAARAAKAYGEPQVLVEAALTRRRAGGTTATHGRKTGLGHDKSAGTSAKFMSKSASQHREFLLQSLSDVQRQLLSTPSALQTFEEQRAGQRAEVPAMHLGATSASSMSQMSADIGFGATTAAPGASQGSSIAFADDAAAPIFSGGATVDARHLAARAYDDGTNLRFVLTHERGGKAWTLVATEADLGMDAGGLAALPAAAKDGIVHKLLKKLKWLDADLSDLAFMLPL